MHERIPLLIVYTGNGKGKTTAALGLLMRAAGHDARCAVIQFIKPARLETGEKRTAASLGVTWENYGEGFTWKKGDGGATRDACRRGWARAKELIAAGGFDLVVLDEFTYALNGGYVDVGEVLAWLAGRDRSARAPHVVITGRNAPGELILLADMVQEIIEVKHPLRIAGVQAQPMIEY